MSSIGDYAFAECSGLTSVLIGSGIKNVGNYAFRDCSELTDIYCYALDVPKIATYTFKDSYIEKATLHVPSESVNAYKTTSIWIKFGNIVALTDSDPKPTGIISINSTSIKDGVFYELSGRKTQNSQQGIYIINGKKYIKNN